MRKLCLISVLFLCLTGFCRAYDLGQIREQIRFRVHDTTNTVTTPRWDNRNIDTRINFYHRQVCNYTECLYTSTLINAVTEQAEYTLPADLKRLDRVAYSISSSTNNYKKLIARSMASLDKEFQGGWEQVKGLPTNYYKRNMKMGLYPKPSGSFASTAAIKIDYYQIPYNVAADTDTFYGGSNPSLYPYEQLIVWAVSADLKREAGEEWQSDMQDYAQWLGLMKDMIHYDPDRPDYIPVTFTVK